MCAEQTCRVMLGAAVCTNEMRERRFGSVRVVVYCDGAAKAF
jgi:hypothetical protein